MGRHTSGDDVGPHRVPQTGATLKLGNRLGGVLAEANEDIGPLLLASFIKVRDPSPEVQLKETVDIGEEMDFFNNFSGNFSESLLN